MFKKFLFSFLLIILILSLCFINNKATSTLIENQPAWYFLNLHSYKKFMHVLGTAFGLRALVSDFHYISFLQYYGDLRNAKTRYKDLLNYFNDATDADPGFEFVYLYGSAILAFNLKKYDEATELITKGLNYNPKIWRLRLYLAAIGYKEKDNKEKYVKFLEDAIKYEDHPAMIERLLGNIYEQIKSPDEAAKYWVSIYKKTKDKATREHAYNRLIYMMRNKLINDIDEILK